MLSSETDDIEADPTCLADKTSRLVRMVESQSSSGPRKNHSSFMHSLIEVKFYQVKHPHSLGLNTIPMIGELDTKSACPSSPNIGKLLSFL